MWDWEGKDADPNVVRKLLINYPDFFKEHRLGSDVFLTLRVANPSVERTDQKAVLEALASIPRSYDVASQFYSGKAVPPVFEVILPMTTKAAELNQVSSYYEKLTTVNESSSPEWIGEFQPKQIEVIPLLENFDGLLHADEIVREYVGRRGPAYARVFLARSDPALNYGMVSAVLLCKIALAKLHNLVKELGLDLYPIIGAGSLPFRGNLTPLNLPNFMETYSGARTITIQSALKYDFEKESTKALIQTLNSNLATTQPRTLTDSQVTLTAWGSFFQALLRITGPVLLGLTLLALRARVKR